MNGTFIQVNTMLQMCDHSKRKFSVITIVGRNYNTLISKINSRYNLEYTITMVCYFYVIPRSTQSFTVIRYN